MSVKKSSNAAVKQLENELKKSRMLNYILIALCAVLIVVCIVIAAVSCGSSNGVSSAPAAGTSAPVETDRTVCASGTDIPVGTYQRIAPDDSYGFALEFTEEGAVWFYEATKDGSLVQGFVGELVATSDTDCYSIPLFHVDFVPYTTASVKIETAENGQISITQIDKAAPLSNMIPFGEAITLTYVEDYKLSQTVVALYSDEMSE